MIDRLPAHPSAIAQIFQDVPPGWTYNPASWRERLPIIGVALLGFGIASYHVVSTHQCATRHLADGSSGRLGLRRSGADARSYCRPYDPYRRHDSRLRGDSACAMDQRAVRRLAHHRPVDRRV